MIKIDDTEYQIENMTDEQKALTSLVQQCQGKVAAIKSEYDIVQTALNSFAQALKESLQKDD
jgi:cell division protein ZapA (FtsZ GTPase activity inhibitor)